MKVKEPTYCGIPVSKLSALHREKWEKNERFILEQSFNKYNNMKYTKEQIKIMEDLCNEFRSHAHTQGEIHRLEEAKVSLIQGRTSKRYFSNLNKILKKVL